MPEAFDAYYKWLGISPKDQPPNHYRLLGIDVFEDNPDVITSAADKQMAHVRSFQTGQHSALSQKLLNEIAAARICLLNAVKKTQYDEKLRGRLAALESQPQQAEAFDTSKIGLDFSATQSTPVVKRPRKSHGTKLPWQLPAAIAAAILASAAIIAYLLSNPPEGEKPVTQAKADAPSKQNNEGTPSIPKQEKPPKPESKPEAKPEVKPEPEPRESESKPEVKPEPKSEPRPEPIAEAPEKVVERLKDAFAKAKTATDFRIVAIDALKLIDQANSAGKQDVAKSVVMLALSAARKADDDELAKTATFCVLEPGAKPVAESESSLDNRKLNNPDQERKRLPIPDAAAQEQALKLVKEVFKEKSSSAATSEKQKALVQDLLQKAEETYDDTTAQYVMLKEAGRIAIQARDAALAFWVIEEMGTRFEVDTFDLKANALTAIGKLIGANEQSTAIVESLLALMEEATTKEHYDTAKQLGSTATDVARKSKDSVLLKATVARKGTIIKEMAEIQKAQAEVEEAVATLDKNPTDPPANLAVGKFCCFTKNQWDKGISMLALGDDAALKDLALKELKEMTDAAEQAKFGDAWWGLGDKKNGLAKKNIQGHAASWYLQALPNLSGLVKAKVEKRVATESRTESIKAGSSVNIIYATYGVPGKQVDVTSILQKAIERDHFPVIQSDSRAFGDPAHDEAKRLIGMCQCGKNRVSLSLSDNEVAVLPPVPPAGIRLSNASQKFAVLAARYGAGLTWRDVTESVRSLVPDPSKPFTAKFSYFGADDPWFGVRKHLVIWFDYRGTRYARVVLEDETTHTLVP